MITDILMTLACIGAIGGIWVSYSASNYAMKIKRFIIKKFY